MLDRVTYHAIFRYLERVLGLPVDEWLVGTELLPDRERVAIACERAGLPVDAVRELILSKPVQRVVAAGFRDCVVRLDGFSYVISGGKVTTVLTNWMRDSQVGQLERMKEQTRSQLKKDFQKANRRFRGKRKSIQRQMQEVD
ncbi:hypothetical protein G6L45_16180 [Agrobacterium rhizogenes]|nr:hypothetical protein [Rhizobium rhizogenes]NTH97022.1 hypothetical protein [Rhizobium rhizogenes]NTJ15208.1 hypothetical protein [Rhizobium rhizogenes]